MLCCAPAVCAPTAQRRAGRLWKINGFLVFATFSQMKSAPLCTLAEIKTNQSCICCLVVPPAARLLWDSTQIAPFCRGGCDQLWNLLSWSPNRPHHLQWLAGERLICSAERVRGGQRGERMLETTSSSYLSESSGPHL